MSKIETVGMDVIAEIASEIVERYWFRMNGHQPHSFFDDNGDFRYVEEAQNHFNDVFDIIDNALNPEI